MQEKKQDHNFFQNIDVYSLITDVLRNWWVILLGALAAAMIANIVVKEQSHTENTYTTSATFVVSAKGSNSSVYNNLSTAQNLASTFSNILNSGIMQKVVCEDLGLTSFDATASASVISETNLLVLTVSANSPKMAYQVIRSIMENYSTITTSVVGSLMVEVLKDPEVPAGSGGYVNTRAAMKKGFLAGAVGFILLFAVLSYRNDTIKNSNDLSDKLDAKALGTIYHEKKYKSFHSWWRHKKNSLLVTNTTASFAFVESYKKIATKLSYMKQAGKGEIIVITSVLENEGKSTVAANLALTFAKNSDRVLLMDCDLRHPSQHLILNKRETQKKEWTALLSEDSSLQDIFQYDSKRRLFTLLATKKHTNSSEILSSETIQKLMTSLRKCFDYIIVDSPPLSVAVDAEVLSDQADLSVLVVRYNQVQAEDINDAIDTLSSCNAELAGCVLNQARSIPKLNPGPFGYGAGYGYGYGYGKYGKKVENRKDG